jgi:hypothetical protein
MHHGRVPPTEEEEGNVGFFPKKYWKNVGSTFYKKMLLQLYA